MELGGVLLASGMEMDIAHGDYRYGSGRVHFLVREILEIREEWGHQWVVLQGHQRPACDRPWAPRRLQIKVSALKRSLTLSTA